MILEYPCLKCFVLTFSYKLKGFFSSVSFKIEPSTTDFLIANISIISTNLLAVFDMSDINRQLLPRKSRQKVSVMKTKKLVFPKEICLAF